MSFGPAVKIKTPCDVQVEGQRYVSSGPVRSVIAHSLPANFDCSSTNFLFQIQSASFAGFFHFTIHAHHRAAMLAHVANAGSAFRST